MKILLLSVVLVVLLSAPLIAQQDFRSVESTTFRLYTEQKWDSLVTAGNRAIRNGHDYYYLRLRMGIACFESQKYILASHHLRYAFRFNQSDPVAAKYLYRSLVYSNRPDEARYVASCMPGYLKTELMITGKIVESTGVTGGMTFSENNRVEKDPYLFGSDSLYGEKDVYGNSWDISAGLKFNLSPAVSLAAGYTYLDFSKIRYFQYGSVEDHLDSTTSYFWGYQNHYSWNRKTYNSSYRYHIKQHQLYLGADFILPEGFSVKPAAQLISVRYTDRNAEFVPEVIHDTIIADTITPYYLVYSYPRFGYHFTVQDKSFYDWLFSVMLSKDYSLFNTALSASYSHLNGKRQTQVGWWLTCYPLGNLDLYESSVLYGFFEGDQSRLIFSQTVGGKLYKRLWAEGSVVIGDLANANLVNGSLIYNTTDRTRYLLEAGLVVLLSRQVQLSLNYRFAEKKSMTYYYKINAERAEQVTGTSDYHTHSITGGLLWKL